MARAVGINHVALEVGDVGEAVEFWQRFFGPLGLRGQSAGMAFLDLGDQFVALARSGAQPGGGHRHFGLVVDDKESIRERVREAGRPAGSKGGKLRVDDPWGNTIEVVDYRDVQFTKDPDIARAMGLDAQKSEQTLAELREKGLA